MKSSLSQTYNITGFANSTMMIEIEIQSHSSDCYPTWSYRLRMWGLANRPNGRCWGWSLFGLLTKFVLMLMLMWVPWRLQIHQVFVCCLVFGVCVLCCTRGFSESDRAPISAYYHQLPPQWEDHFDKVFKSPRKSFSSLLSLILFIISSFQAFVSIDYWKLEN